MTKKSKKPTKRLLKAMRQADKIEVARFATADELFAALEKQPSKK